MITTASTTRAAGAASPNCVIEIFSDAKDEGAVYEGTTTADAAGNWAFTKPGGLTGPNVTATATDAAGNTSEFSAPRSVLQATPTPTLTPTPTGAPTATPEWNLYLPMILRDESILSRDISPDQNARPGDVESG